MVGQLIVPFLLAYFSLIEDALTAENNPAFIGYVTVKDKSHFRTVFEKQINRSPTNPSELYHAILGLHSLGEKIPNIDAICSALNKPVKNPDLAFYASMGQKILGSAKCKVSIQEVEKLSKQLLAQDITVENLYFIISSMKNLGIKIDANQVTSIVNKLKAKDNSPTTIAFILQILPQLGLTKTVMDGYASGMNDILDQADEVNGNQLFYEKGLYTTSLVAKGIVEFVNVYGEIPKAVEGKLVKLFNYLYARRQVTNTRAAAHMAAAFKALADSTVMMPIVVEPSVNMNDELNLAIPSEFSVDRANPNLNLRLKHLWTGVYIKPSEFTLKAHGLYNLVNKKIDENQVLVGPTDRGDFKQDDKNNIFQVSLLPDPKSTATPSPGYYALEISAVSKKAGDRRKLLGLTNVQVPLRVITEAKVGQTTVTIMDTAHERHIADISLTPGQTHKASTASGAINLDVGQQITLDLHLTDGSSSSHTQLTAHQVFVQLTHQKTLQAITYTCSEIIKDKQTGKKNYQLFLDPDASAAEFDYLSGVYKAELIVGDSLIKTPLIWHMFDLDLHFVGEAGDETKRRIAQATDVSRQQSSSPAALKRASNPNAIIGSGPTSAKPEIEHMFRAPEKRAPPFLALSFTVLCLLPLLGLLIAWMVIGFNVSNFKVSISNIVFHAGLICYGVGGIRGQDTHGLYFLSLLRLLVSTGYVYNTGLSKYIRYTHILSW
uniref:Dolichyl-diphosphooligosaccharide--protein glycosyltransferase subunit 2 n=1 Tax=Trichobilharzia regenti TaxID=157069 RepID=A0AA85J6W3_TRIRE|nr:unnamed protein product [Trichobilharzia regenti]